MDVKRPVQNTENSIAKFHLKGRWRALGCTKFAK